MKVNEIIVTYKASVHPQAQVKSSADIHRFALEAWPNPAGLDLQESFCIFLLNRANRIIAMHELSRGGIAGTVVDTRLVFGIALAAAACSIVLVHNHPSGNTQPSQADIEMTRKLSQAGKLLDIQVLDHVIVTSENGYYSFADEGLT